MIKNKHLIIYYNMADRTCADCGKVFTSPCWLRKHKNRKTSCAPIARIEDISTGADKDQNKAFKCPYCNRRFTAHTNMRRHVRDYCKIAPNERNGTEGMEKLCVYVLQQQRDAEQIRNQAEQIQDQRERLERLEQMMAGGSHQQAGGITIQGDHNRAVVNQVVLNFHGKEDPKRVSTERVRQAVESGGTTNDIVGSIMRAIYHEIPENRNAWLSNKKDDLAMVYEGTTEEDAKWITKDRKEILPGMVAKSAIRLLDADYALLEVLEEGSPAQVKKDKAVRELIGESFTNDVPTESLLRGLGTAQRATLIANRPTEAVV